MRFKSLPLGVPELPPGRFYRIREKRVFSFPLLTMEIRARQRFGSARVAEIVIDPADWDTPAEAIRWGCGRLAELSNERELRRARGAAALGYVGDYEADRDYEAEAD